MNLPILPTPDTIPVHWLWFQVLLTFTFILHLLFMNMILGGSLLTLWDLFKRKKTDQESHELPTILALTINLGVPPLLFVQVIFGHFFYSSSVMMAVFWILVIPILILAYYAAYIFSRQIDKKPVLAKVSLITATVFLLYIAFMFVNNSTMAIQPDKWSNYFQHPGGTMLNWSDASLWPRYLHFIVAAVAIAALMKAAWNHFFNKSLSAEEKEKRVKGQLRIFGFATMFQFIIGTWFWLAMPNAVTKAFMGGNLVATLLMIIVWISALLIIFFAIRGKFLKAFIQGIFQVVLMAVVREISRSEYLSGLFKPSELINVHQVSPLIVFLLIFIIGLLLLYFMYQLTLTPKSKEL